MRSSAVAAFVLLSLTAAASAIEFPVLNRVPDLIRYWGYECEDHWVTTGDGYILNLQRIPKVDAPAVYLQHGLFGSSARYTAGPPDKSLAYILSDLGYDVWLGNTRGNTYGRNHTTLDPDVDLETFWYFDWDVAGCNDLPSAFDYVLDVTGEDDLVYVGHSMGSSEFLTLMSQHPAEQAKLSSAFLFAPPSYFSGMTGALAELADHVFQLETLFEEMEIWEFLKDNPKTSDLGHEKCDEENFLENEELCLKRADQIVGCSPDQLNTSMLPIYFDVWPEGSSVKPMVHYGQLINTPDFFGKYDFRLGNMEHYGTSTPPAYNLSAITMPVHIFYGNGDSLVAVQDVLRLIDELPNVQLAYEVPFDGWAHNDMVYGIDAPELLYYKVIEYMAPYTGIDPTPTQSTTTTTTVE